MNGLMGLQSLMIKSPKVPSTGGQAGAAKGADGAAVSFQKFLKQQQGQGIKATQERKPMSAEEMKLLKNSFVFLTELKLRLSEETEISGPFSPFNKKLKKLLEDMGENMEFLALLPNHLQEVLKDYLQQMNGSFDPKAIEALVGQWNQFKKEKATPVIGEVNDLLNAVKNRLNQAGVTVDVEEKENKAKVVFSEGKEGKLPVASKSLLNRISKFLNKTDDMPEKIALKAETLELRENLRKHLNRGQQPVGWHKDEIVHKAQNATLRNLEVGQQAGAKQQVSSLTMEKLIKEEAKGIDLTQPTKENEEENGTSIKKIDQSMGIILNSDSDQSPTRMVKENHRSQGFFNLQPEEVIAQMVEKFRIQVKDGASQMEIQLQPEELGRLKLSLSIEEGVVTARLLTGNIHVKELIEQNLPQLRESFAKDGLQWDEITVDVSQDDLGGNAFTSQGQENLDQRRNRSRRGRGLEDLTDDEFDLGGVAGLEEEEAKRDPDRLVDYMA